MLINTPSTNSHEQELTPTQLAEQYGFERHQKAQACPLPAKAPKSFLKPMPKKFSTLY